MSGAPMPQGERRRRRLLLAAAALWGFAEATVFFLVPDVLLSAIALRRRRFAFVACLAAVAGALPGGALMYAWGRDRPAEARAFLDRVPAISAARIGEVNGELAAHGLPALVAGQARGTPYKIYAVESGARGLPLARFLAVSAPARWARFALVTLLAGWLAKRFAAGAPARTPYAWWLGAWAGFYTLYFWLIRG
jgi:membrane protein YqaA with SNARE-associated domain